MTELDKNNPLIYSDEDLVRKIIESKDNYWFGILYDRYEKMVYNKCYHFSQNQEEAMDMAHDIFLKLFLNIQKYSGKSKFKTWLYSFTYNFCINYVTREKTMQHDLDKLEEVESLQDYNDEDIFNLRIDLLPRALLMLPQQDQAILLMKYQDDFKIEQISNVLEIGKSAVKMKLLRAKSRLVAAYHKLETLQLNNSI